MRYFIGTVALMCAAIASVIAGVVCGCQLTVEYPLGMAFFSFFVPTLIYALSRD